MDRILTELAAWSAATWQSIVDRAATVADDRVIGDAALVFAVVAAVLAVVMMGTAVAVRRSARRATDAAARVEEVAARVEALVRDSSDLERTQLGAVPEPSVSLHPAANTVSDASVTADPLVNARIETLGVTLETHHKRLVAEVETIKTAVADLRAEVVEHQTAKYRVNEAIRQAMAPRRGSNT